MIDKKTLSKEWEETISILSDQELMYELKKAQKEYAANQMIPEKKLLEELGIAKKT